MSDRPPGRTTDHVRSGSGDDDWERPKAAPTHESEIANPLFAAVYRAFRPIDRREFGPHRRRLSNGLSGRVLDLGAGDGASIPYVERAVDRGTTDAELSYVAIEPDPHMRRRGRQLAEGGELDIDFVSARAESLPFADDSFDGVLAMLVFCTIADPQQALDEVARVLRPGGELRYLEHVGGDGTWGRVQQAITPIWNRLAGGCHLDRDTVDRFEADARLEPIESTTIDTWTYPAAPVVRGRLERRSD